MSSEDFMNIPPEAFEQMKSKQDSGEEKNSESKYSEIKSSIEPNKPRESFKDKEESLIDSWGSPKGKEKIEMLESEKDILESWQAGRHKEKKENPLDQAKTLRKQDNIGNAKIQERSVKLFELGLAKSNHLVEIFSAIASSDVLSKECQDEANKERMSTHEVMLERTFSVYERIKEYR